MVWGIDETARYRVGCFGRKKIEKSAKKDEEKGLTKGAEADIISKLSETGRRLGKSGNKKSQKVEKSA